jgi:hypothetical protein
LSDTLAETVALLRSEFDKHGPQTPSAGPVPTPPVSSAPVAPVLVSPQSAPDAAEPRRLGSRGEVADLRGRDLGVPKSVEVIADAEEELTADA